MHFYIISDSKKSNIIDLTLIKDNMMGIDKENPIIIDSSEEKESLLEKKTNNN